MDALHLERESSAYRYGYLTTGALEMITTTIGFDIAKAFFQVRGVDGRGKTTI
jgi:hypothetical protein